MPKRDQLIEIINEYIETLPPAQTKRGVPKSIQEKYIAPTMRS
jgi:hypothetical protein